MEGFAGGSEMSFPSGMKHWKDEEAGLGISDRPRAMPRRRLAALPLPGTSTIGPMSIPRGWSLPPCSFGWMSARIADDTEKTPESGRGLGKELKWCVKSVDVKWVHALWSIRVFHFDWVLITLIFRLEMTLKIPLFFRQWILKYPYVVATIGHSKNKE